MNKFIGKLVVLVVFLLCVSISPVAIAQTNEYSAVDESEILTDGMKSGLSGNDVYDSSIEQIESFISFININKDASINIKETIVYNFGPYERHGIYRDIPITYKTYSGKKIRLDLSDVLVTDENNNPVSFTSSKSGNDRRLKIGDADVFLKGVHTYVISYTVTKAVGFFDTFDEIYWNITGNGWQVPIKNVEAHITIPYSVPSDVELVKIDNLVKIYCYAGLEGSTTKCDSMEGVYNDRDPVTISFNQNNLKSYEGLTVAVGFPKGFVTPPTDSEKFASSVSDFFADGWWLFLLPILVFVWRYRKWSSEGRDPKGTGVIIAQYEAPDGLSPMQIRFILKQEFGDSLSAEIVYLATKGCLKINKIKNEGIFSSKEDYEFVMLKEPGAELSEYQTYLLRNLFSSADASGAVKLSDLKYSFYKVSDGTEDKVEETLVAGGYFPPAKISKFGRSTINGRNASGKVSAIFAGLFITVFFGIWGAFFVAAVLGDQALLPFLISWVLAGIIWIIFSIIMPRMTEKGVATKEAIQGFELYLSVAEKDRINFHNAPAKNPETFEKFLPYAMALCVEKEWAKVFEGISLTPPSWYNDSSMAGFNAGLFASSMSSFASSSSSTMSSAPGSSSGSSGGGSSGGGGGGGGGGSW